MLQTQIASNELLPIWLAYEALGRGLLHQLEAAQDLLERAFKVAEDRGEELFLPELHCFAAWIASYDKDSEKVADQLEIAAKLAADTGAVLFAEHIRADAKKLRPRTRRGKRKAPALPRKR